MTGTAAPKHRSTAAPRHRSTAAPQHRSTSALAPSPLKTQILNNNDPTMPSPPGYSDRINHALAFAAKHHDQQVRKGTGLPYLTHPANVAIILTSYGCDEETILGGILHDVVEDCVRDGVTREALERRVGDKFGAAVLDTVLAVTQRRHDDDGVELSSEERKSDYLERLASASERARWVCAADKVHNGASILADLRRTIDPDSVWSRFNVGREGTIRWYRRVHDRLREVGFSAPIMTELARVAEELEEWLDPARLRVSGPGPR